MPTQFKMATTAKSTFADTKCDFTDLTADIGVAVAESLHQINFNKENFL